MIQNDTINEQDTNVLIQTNGYPLDTILSSTHTAHTSKHGTKFPDSNIIKANTKIPLKLGSLGGLVG